MLQDLNCSSMAISRPGSGALVSGGCEEGQGGGEEQLPGDAFLCPLRAKLDNSRWLLTDTWAHL